MGQREGRRLQPGIMWPVLSCTEEEKAEARAFEEDQVAGRLKEDVVSMEGVGVTENRAFPQVFTPLLSLCSWSREAGYRSRWQRR